MFSCIVIFYNCAYTVHYIESANFWHITTSYSSSEFLGFASETAFLRPGDWAGHSITSILFIWKQDVACLLMSLGSLSCGNTLFRGISSSAQGNIIYSNIQVFWCIQTDPWPWSLVHDKNGQLHSMKNIPITWFFHQHAVNEFSN